MKKSGILHSDLAAIVAGMGHGDKLVICDCGYPIPHDRPVADCVLTVGVPGLVETLKVVLGELHIEGAMMAKFRNWEESQNLVIEGKPEEFAAIVARVEKTLAASKDKGTDDASGWRLISKVPVDANAVYFGISNEYTENKSIRINSYFRSDGKAKDAPFPGADHAPALPLDILVINDGKKVRAVQYGEMWRMQLYFWDSGYTAFAKNTLVPSIIFGSIEKALTEPGS